MPTDRPFVLTGGPFVLTDSAFVLTDGTPRVANGSWGRTDRSFVHTAGAFVRTDELFVLTDVTVIPAEGTSWVANRPFVLTDDPFVSTDSASALTDCRFVLPGEVGGPANGSWKAAGPGCAPTVGSGQPTTAARKVEHVALRRVRGSRTRQPPPAGRTALR